MMPILCVYQIIHWMTSKTIVAGPERNETANDRIRTYGLEEMK